MTAASNVRSLRREGRRPFPTDKPTELRSALERFDEDVQGQLQALERRRGAAFRSTAIGRFLASTPTVTLELSGLNRVDCTGGNVTAVLPRPDARDAGATLLVSKESDAGILYVVPPGGATLNGRAMVSFSRRGLYVFAFDGENYVCQGGSGPAVEFLAAGSPFGATTGSISGSLTDSGRQDVALVMTMVAQAIATGAAACRGVGVGGSPTFSLIPLDSVSNSTVGAAIAFLPRGMLPALGQNFSLSVTDIANDQVAGALWVTNGSEASLSLVTSGTGTSITSGDITTIRPGALVIDVMANDDDTNTGTPGTGQTEIFNGSAGGATIAMQASWKSMPIPGDTTMSWTGLTAATNKAHLAIVIEPAEAA